MRCNPGSNAIIITNSKLAPMIRGEREEVSTGSLAWRILVLPALSGSWFNKFRLYVGNKIALLVKTVQLVVCVQCSYHKLLLLRNVQSRRVKANIPLRFASNWHVKQLFIGGGN